MEKGDVAVVRQKVQRYLLEVLHAVEVDRDGDFTFRQGSARIFVSVLPFREDRTTVNIHAAIVRDIPASPEVYKFIATEGSFSFGHMTCSEREGKITIYLGHTLLGDFLDPEELKMATFLLAQRADEVDDKIVGKFGGKRFHED